MGLAFQTSPFQCLRIVRTAENHFLAPNQNYDVVNLGPCMASDENLWGANLSIIYRRLRNDRTISLSVRRQAAEDLHRTAALSRQPEI
jgi:hypothetical protein